MSAPDGALAEQFADLPQQRQAARLGILVFLASEGLLFAGLFALYASYRAHFPAAFAAGVRENLRWNGTLNTAILLVGSGLAAIAVARLREGQARPAVARLRLTAAIGVAFLALKGYEYAIHLHKGILIGGRGEYFRTHSEPGLTQFFDLYWLMTGLHAVHMVVGIAWIVIASRAARAGIEAAPRVELAAMYWHFIDLVWVFLWPLFYLTGGGF